MPADDCLWAENCNRAEDGREPTIEPNEQRSVLLSCGRFDTCRRSTLSCWRRTRISATSFALGLKSEAMMWRISRSNEHQVAGLPSLSLASSRIQFSVHTTDLRKANMNASTTSPANWCG